MKKGFAFQLDIKKLVMFIKKKSHHVCITTVNHKKNVFEQQQW